MMKSRNSGYILIITLFFGILIIGLIMAMRDSTGATKTERGIEAIKQAEAVKTMLEQRDREQGEY